MNQKFKSAAMIVYDLYTDVHLHILFHKCIPEQMEREKNQPLSAISVGSTPMIPNKLLPF